MLFARVRPPRPLALSLEELVSAREYAGSFFYNEFIRAVGDDTFRCLGTQVVNRWGSGIVAIHRGQNQGSFESEDVGGLHAYVTALRRMLTVRGRFAATDRRLQSVEAMLDHVGQAAILVRADESIAHANAMGEALLRRNDALTLRDGALKTCSGPSAIRLKQAIDAACARSGMGASALLIERLSGRPLAISVIPFRAGNGTRHALLIVEGEAKEEEAVRKLRSLYGLTPAEAEIGIRIGTGASPQGIADGRGVSVETVRSQIKALSAKLGCTRQSEVIALINALPAINVAGREEPTGDGFISARFGHGSVA
jgi:DNA-binding CsgD family transcriptional regulator